MFDDWNKGELDSFLIEITANILRFKGEDGQPQVPKILDKAGQVIYHRNKIIIYLYVLERNW